ncbi:ead/Ea22-like family protein [Enterobacter kobei]|uniref:ead/Ea22-like family protein n=1 Tax=Enterobacter kobei TaxID=208224 RepID=UPI00403F61D1
MSNIDKQELREAAERAESDSWGYDRDEFNEALTPSTVLALLDELEAKDRRIEEEIGRANREHHRGFMMACGHLKEHSNTHYADAAEMEIAALRKRINELENAAAGKGEAS